MELDRNKLNSYFEEIKICWSDAKATFPDFLREVPYTQKLHNEQYLQSVAKQFKEQLNKFSRPSIRKREEKKKLFLLVNKIMAEETVIGIHQYMDSQTLEAYQEELIEFLRHERTFSPELPFESIGQGIRNYIVYIMFNELNKKRPGFNTACFGYSMLYPFTDNYIDNKAYSSQDKHSYNRLIRDKLEGKKVTPSSSYEGKTCELLDMIEASYPRHQDNTIYTLLLLMLEAQEGSLKQHRRPSKVQTHNLTLDEILDISVKKGGLSVLIDRFFVQKEMTEHDLTFYLSFGLFLQLADDLQDIGQDYEEGSQTLFTANLGHEAEEQLVNKLLHFLYGIMDQYTSENEGFKQFLISNCYQLIYSSIAGSKEFFSQEYLDHLEQYLPVTFPYLEKMYLNRLDNIDMQNQERYIKILDELIF